MTGRYLCAAALWGTAVAAQDPPLPPPGHGTLKQADVAVEINTVNLQLRLIPLAPGVIRLLAPDAHQALKSLLDTWQPRIDSIASQRREREPRVMFVTLYALQPDVRFDPQQLFIESRSRFYRPLDILPLTTSWNRQQIRQREQLAALYLFSGEIPVLEDVFTVSFEGVSSTRWARSRRLLEQERSRAFARASRASPDSAPNP